MNEIMTLGPLKIILTACGCPGASTLIRMLKQNGERDIEIIGTDMNPEAVGRYLCDGFHKVPSGTSSEYIPAMMDIVEKEKPDIIFPESSNEVLSLARSKKSFEEIDYEMNFRGDDHAAGVAIKAIVDGIISFVKGIKKKKEDIQKVRMRRLKKTEQLLAPQIRNLKEEMNNSVFGKQSRQRAKKKLEKIQDYLKRERELCEIE